jgi:hypothetical protein
VQFVAIVLLCLQFLKKKIPNFTGLSYINCLIPLNLCFDLIIISSTAIFSFGWKKSWETLPAWSINGCTLVIQEQTEQKEKRPLQQQKQEY